MSTLDDFASRVSRIEELPEPFRAALQKQVQPQEEFRLLVHSPVFKTLSLHFPPTVFAVSDRRWIVVTEREDGLTVDECGFGDTLLLELTSILLHGQLKIDYAVNGKARSTAVMFNTVREKEYRAGIEMILARIKPRSTEGRSASADTDVEEENWPYKFHNNSRFYLPEGSQRQAAVYWPTVYGGFHRELSPAAALLLTERDLVLVSEERSPLWFRPRDEQKLGVIVTYFPLSRLAKFHVSEHDRLGFLSLEMHAQHGGERLDVMFPPEQAQAVSHLMESAVSVPVSQDVRPLSPD